MESDELIGLAQLGAIWLIAVFAAYFMGFFRMPPRGRAEPKLSLGFLLGALSILFLLMVVVVPFGLVAIQLLTVGEVRTGEAVDPTLFAYFSLLLYVALPTLTFAYAYRSLGTQQLQTLLLGPQPDPVRRAPRDFMIGLSTWILAIFPVSLLHHGLRVAVQLLFEAEVAEQVAVRQLKQSVELGPLFWATAFSMIAVIPLFEEFLFRGIVQTWFRTRLGRLNAILLSSAMFAGVHFSFEQGLSNIELLGSLFVFSLFLGYVYERQQSLVAPVALHSLFNAISVLHLLN